MARYATWLVTRTFSVCRQSDFERFSYSRLEAGAEIPLTGFNSQRRDVTASSPAQRDYPF